MRGRVKEGGEEMDRRVQPIAIGPIKYVTHDTIRYDWEERYFHYSSWCARYVSYILRRQVDHGRASPTIWTGGRTDGRMGWELIYRDDTSILLAYILQRAVECEKSIIIERAPRLPKMLPFFRRCLLRKVPFLFLGILFLYIYIYTPNLGETLLSTFVIKVPNSSRDWRCDKS